MSAPDLVDIGLNLSHDSFDHDRDAVLARGVAAGVTRMLVTGSDVAHSRKASELAHNYPRLLRSTAGVHPHHAKDFQARDLAELRALLTQPEVLAVGECGLDYFRDISPRADQERVFRLQLQLAVEIGKPIFMHERDAHDAFVNIVGDYLPHIAGGVAHCFTGTVEQVTKYVELGLSIGVTGWICDERRGQTLREAVRHVPLDRLLIETDAPYLIPRNLKPKPKSHRNEPQYLPSVLERLAVCREESVEMLGAATTANALRLFRWE